MSHSESEIGETAYVAQCYGTNKHRKMDDKPDRLSALPNHLLLHILSSFEMKDVIRTGVFHSPESNRNVTTFIKSIDDTLILSKPSKLNEFAVEFLYSNQFVDHINRWMIFVKIKSVEVVDLNLLRRRGLEKGYSLPQLMYSNVCLRKIKLSNCNIVPNEGIYWPALRVLALWYAKLSLEVVDAICSGCPGLESLKFCICFGLTIWARNVTSLEISACLYKKIPVLQNVQALVHAKLYFGREHEDGESDVRTDQKMLKDLLVSLGHVEKLSIGPWCLQVLTILESRNWRCPLMKCKYLTLHTRLGELERPGSAILLQSCPQVEILIISSDGSTFEHNNSGFNEDSNDLTGENYWISRPCWGRRLKTLRIYGTWIYKSCYFEQIMPFLEAVLKNGIVLEKIILTPFKDGISIYPMQHARVTQKLLSFPRSSEDVVIVFSSFY
ncbi:F-box protein like [Capsicum chacoense]